MTEPRPPRYAYIVASALFVAFIGFLGWLAGSIAGIDARLTALETKVTSHDRIFAQVERHESRIDVIEAQQARIEHEHDVFRQQQSP